ncbi:hypothetical protein JKA74_09945 [Marivirga sp. S37H4]|uniref:Lipoprotein SmpA/OmlA domain-containing protein n=1 Tax=Marivirga aurantiaca TaxID=2802615 RepID=A0A935C883_9BACT|nr:hypothetical protein [Marivirga aurantiaca]MBK6265360.1 hypothetical protein [Marivirga aurantiaca]
MKNSIILLSVLLTALGCASTKKLSTPLDFNSETGLNNIMRGTTEETILRTLGEPEFIDREWEQTENLKYYNYYSKGVQISVKDKKALCVFLFYKSKKFKKYSGSNNIFPLVRTIEGVKSTFGEPDYFSQSTNKEYGEFPRQEETYISYEQPGISFTFWNGELGDIRFTKNQEDSL